VKPEISKMEMEVIRRGLKSVAPSLSVRWDRGTAAAWITIRGSGEWGRFTDAERRALDMLGLAYGVNSAVISPEDRRFYVEKAAKVFNIPIPREVGEDYRKRDEYRERLEREAEERRRRFSSCEHQFVKMPYVVIPLGYAVYRCTKCGMEKVEEEKP
jgi:hypothetical protein